MPDRPDRLHDIQALAQLRDTLVNLPNQDLLPAAVTRAFRLPNGEPCLGRDSHHCFYVLMGCLALATEQVEGSAGETRGICQGPDMVQLS